MQLSAGNDFIGYERLCQMGVDGFFRITGFFGPIILIYVLPHR